MNKATLVLGAFGALALLLYLGACAFLYVYQARFLFPGAFLPYPAELARLAGAYGLQPETIAAPDGERLFALRADPAPGQPVVLLFHGNGSYPESYGFLYGSWLASGYGVVAPAARGYPRSGGKPEGEKMLADALAVHDWAVQKWPGHALIVVGQSLGTAAAVHVAANRPVERLVLISPFQSMLSLVRSKLPYFPIGLLLTSPFRSDLDMPKVEAPLLIVHGGADTLVPPGSARALASLARSPVRFLAVPGAGHVAGLFTPQVLASIDDFMGLNNP